MNPATWSVPLIATLGGFLGAGLACYQITGDLMSPATAITGHLGYVASVTGEFGANSASHPRCLLVAPNDLKIWQSAKCLSPWNSCAANFAADRAIALGIGTVGWSRPATRLSRDSKPALDRAESDSTDSSCARQLCNTTGRGEETGSRAIAAYSSGVSNRTEPQPPFRI
jgi:hypothetical protein